MTLRLRLVPLSYGLILMQSAVVLWMLNPKQPTVFLLWLMAVALLAARMRFKMQGI